MTGSRLQSAIKYGGVAVFRCVVGSAAVVAALVCTLGPARAESILWKNVPGWRIAAEPDFGMGCYMETVYEDDMIFRLGLNYADDDASVYLILGHERWKSLENGKEYELSFQFHKGESFKIVAAAMRLESGNYLVATLTDVAFITNLRRKLGARIFFEGNLVNAITLKGTAVALDEIDACDKAVEEAKNKGIIDAPTTDPFAVDTKPKKKPDPFEM